MIDEALRARLSAIVARHQPTTEAELRQLADEADACERILRGQLERHESRLGALASDSHAALDDIVAELRQVRGLRSELEELRAALAELDVRAREIRAGWLTR